MSKAVDRALSILIYIANSERRPTLSNICAQLDIPKASASELLCTLMENGFVRMADPDQKTFALGEKVLQLGNAYRRQTNCMDQIHAEMERYSGEIGKTIFFWRCEQSGMVLMDRVLSKAGIYPNFHIGHLEGMDSLMGKAYQTGQEQVGPAGDPRILCYAEPLRDAEGKMEGVLTIYDWKNLTEPCAGEQIRKCASDLSKRIYTESE